MWKVFQNDEEGIHILDDNDVIICEHVNTVEDAQRIVNAANKPNIDNGIMTFLDISTGHITKRDNELLVNWNRYDHDKMVSFNSLAYNCVIVENRARGYIVNIDHEVMGKDWLIEGLRKIGLSENFVAIMQLADAAGCYFVNFDGDGTVLPDLETFDW